LTVLGAKRNRRHLLPGALSGDRESLSRRFDEPSKTPDGKTPGTLKDAADYVLALPKRVRAEPQWQRAAECLKNAAAREVAWSGLRDLQ
jgi:hypothetical protein